AKDDAARANQRLDNKVFRICK
ncbi:TPA: hypothetical protein ACQQB4_003483, partial [Salmonella enterica subsp. enterica serovar Blockley]